MSSRLGFRENRQQFTTVLLVGWARVSSDAFASVQIFSRRSLTCAAEFFFAPPARDAGPPLPVDEMTELVAKLTSAIEASPPDEAAIAEVLDALEGSTMTIELLKTTGVGKVVNSLKKKSELAALAGRARALVEQWKKLQTGS